MIRSEDRFPERPPKVWAALAAAMAVAAIPATADAQTSTSAGAAAEPPVAGVEDEGVLMEADVVTHDEEARTITAEGDIQARFQDRTLRADSLIYNLDTRRVVARGNVEISDATGTQYADEVELDEALGLGLATNLRARFSGNGSLAARTAVRRGEGRNELSRVIYTSCIVCEDGSRPPTWAIKARRAVQNSEARSITYQATTLEVMGVPVFFLPYFGHPDPSAGPQSGLLTPAIGRDSRVGLFYDQPYYWRISPYQDAIASLRVHEQVAPLAGFSYNKRFWSGLVSFSGSLTNEQDFDSEGNTFGDESVRGHLFGQGRFRITDYWDWGFGLERASDDLYLARYSITGAGQQRGPYWGDYSRLLSHVYAIGQDDDSFAQVAFLSFQGLRAGDNAQLMPHILPVADYERVFDEPLFDGQVRWTSNAIVLNRADNGVSETNGRVSSGLSWRTNAVIGPGLVFSPFAQARADLYHVNTVATPSTTFSRTVGLAGAEVSWPFMRVGENVNIIVEPVVSAVYASNGGDDSRIINEDSIRFELDDSNLFRASGAPNYDIWEPGGRVSAGVRASARMANGYNASVTFGQRWRAVDAPGFNQLNNLPEGASDYVGVAQVDLGRSFGAVIRARFSDDAFDVEQLDAGVRAALWRFYGDTRYYTVDPGLNAGEPTEQIVSTIGVQLMRGWRLQFGDRRDLSSDINLGQELRAIFEDDCTYLELAYTRSETQDRTLGPNEGFQIRVGLRTLGAIGGSAAIGGQR